MMSSTILGEAKGFQEADATPRPLRIIKRESKIRSDMRSSPSISEEMETMNAGPFIAKGKTSAMEQRREAPPAKLAKRLTSISIVSPHAYAHPPADTCDALHVPKQRRANANAEANTIPKRVSSVLGSIGGVTSSHPNLPRSWHSHGFASDCMDESLAPENDIRTAASYTARAVTTGAIGQSPSQRPFINGPPMPVAATQSFNGTTPRTATAGTRGNGFAAGNSLPYLQPMRSSCTQPSLRQRLFSRVMSGGSGKTNLSHAAAMDREPVAGELHSNAEGKEEPTQETQAKSLTPTTRSSIETMSTLGPNLEQALAAFPTPPVSAVTSPTTVSSFETSHMVPGSCRRLLQPSNVAAAGAELSLLPEVYQLSPDSGQSVFVAVEVTGCVDPIEKTCDVLSSSKGLDVAVVIDGTLFTSPAALLAHCEAARFIASLLDPNIDRLAVLTTRPQKTDPPDFNVVAPLSRTTIRMIKSVVDTIFSSSEKPNSAALRIALNCAIDMVTDSTSQSTDIGNGCDAYGLIFVLTANPCGLEPVLLAHPRCIVHVVCPGSVPWRETHPVTCNGWKLSPSYSNSVQCVSRQKDKDHTSLFNRLRTIVTLAREGKACGKVTDLIIDIEAGPGCSIESVMGQKKVAEIRPGETVTALVRVKVGAVAAKGYTLSTSPTSEALNRNISARDVLDELDDMLGASPTTILVAKLTYKHSLLPIGTRCTTVSGAMIKRSVPGESYDRSVPKDIAPPQALRSRIEVQKRLAFYLATHHPPRHAMLTLQEHFGPNGCRSSCPDYIRLLAEELRFQARITERFDLPSPIQPNLLANHNTSTSLTYEHFGHGLFATSNYKPQDWLIDIPDEETGNHSTEGPTRPEKSPRKPHGQYGHRKAEILRSESKRPVPRPSARQAGVAISTSKRNSGISQPTSKESVDEARKIWSDIRKISRGDRNSLDMGKISGLSNGHGDRERATALKELATKYQRSVGADTLVSLQGRGLRRAKENVAP